MVLSALDICFVARLGHLVRSGGAPADTSRLIFIQGQRAALTDLMGGQIQLMFDSMPSAMPFIKSGKLRAVP
ncbi:hypothetical protein LMG31506_03612 [Cupriavidus yeoncheonensis]|uniref:Uncharacterized protein n=1 Tax=Cupriavidus yeoncheonensis TaxID=1462994 RepID=A0A916IVP4_9BURK|nr:hypothetical protein LMG31506_03612 [Cupriavidus yeoncheonensis]